MDKPAIGVSSSLDDQHVAQSFDESLWRGDKPEIRNFLGGQSGGRRSALLRELLCLELEFRAEHDAFPSRSDYYERFPEDLSLVDEAFAESFPWSTRFDGIRQLGKGAFGKVFLVRDRTLEREVALKVPAADHRRSSGVLDRLLDEARKGAALEHPGIVKVYELHEPSETDPSLYIVMEYVANGSVQKVLESGLVPRRAAELCLGIAEAVAEAHRAGLVHEDLKPANVLLDEDGRPKVADFGLARWTGERGEAGGEAAPRVGGTPQYMSPEQFAGVADGRSDVWAMGVILYQMLTGELPFGGGTYKELRDQICSRRPPEWPGRPGRRVPKALSRICMRCLAADPALRFPSSGALATALRHWLLRRRRAWRWARVGVAAAVTAAAGIATWSYQERAKLRAAAAAADDAYIATEAEEGRQQVLAGNSSQGAVHLRAAYARATARGDVPPSLRFLTARAGATPWRQVREFREDGRNFRGFQLSRDGTRLTAVDQLNQVSAWEVATGRVLLRTPALADPVAVFGFSPNGRRLVVVAGAVAEVWDTDAGRSVYGCRGHEMEIRSAAFSPDSRFLATGSADGTARVWAEAGGEPLVLTGHRATVGFVGFSRNGQEVLTGCSDGTARIWSRATGRVLHTLAGHKAGVERAVWSPDGGILITQTDALNLRFLFWDGRTGQPTGPAVELGFGLANTPAYDRGGSRFTAVTRVADGCSVVVRDLVGKSILARISGHSHPVKSADVSPDGRFLLTSSFDRTVRLWEIASAREVWRWTTDRGPLGGDGWFSADGARAVIEDGVGACAVFDLTNGAMVASLDEPVLAAETGRVLAVAVPSGHLTMWTPVGADATAGRVQFASSRASQALSKPASPSPMVGEDREAASAAFSSDGRWLATAVGATTARGYTTSISMREVGANTDWDVCSLDGSVSALSLDDDGGRLMVVSGRSGRMPDRRIVSIVGRDGEVKDRWETPWPPLGLGFRSHDNKSVAVVMSLEYGLDLIGPQGQRLVVLQPAEPMPLSAAFGRGGGRVAVCDVQGISLYDTATGSRISRIVAPGHQPAAVAFSPGGQMVATGGTDRAVRVWEVATGKQLIAFGAHPRPVERLYWTAGPDWIVAVMSDGGTRVWDASSENRSPAEVMGVR